MSLVETQVRVRGRDFATRVFRGGRGRPLVFLHGAGGVSPTDPALLRLAERFEVIAPVHPGLTDLSEIDELVDVRDVALYHDDLLEALGLEAPAIAGHSFGGMIAAELAAHVPTRVGALVLVAPVGLWRDDAPVADLYATAKIIDQLAWFDPQAPVVAATKAALVQDGVDEVEVRMAAARALATAGKYLWPIPDRGLRRRLYRITAPTAIIWGAEDKYVPAVYAQEFAAGIASSEVHLLPNAGHAVVYEALDQYVDVVAKFVDGTGGSGL